MSRNHEMNGFLEVRQDPLTQHSSQPAISAFGDDELALEQDEPPEYPLPLDSKSYSPSISMPTTKQTEAAGYSRQPPNPLSRQCSLLTQGLLSTSSLSDSNVVPTSVMARASSQASAYSLSSNHGLTSDGGFSSPAHPGTPSPPLPAAMQGSIACTGAKTRTIKFAGDKSAQAPVAAAAAAAAASNSSEQPARRKCISFAGCATKTSAPQPAQETVTAAPKRACTIRFACNSKPTAVATKPVTPPRKQTPSDTQSTPRRIASPFPSSRKHRGSQSTPVPGTSDLEKRRLSSSDKTISPSEAHKLEKVRLRKLASNRPEDEAWINEKPKERKPITVTDTLRKENAIRQLGQEAEQEALEEAMDELIDDDEDDEEEDGSAGGSRYMAFDEDGSDDGHETDDEGGFASDDDSDDDPDFQFWTNGHSTAATSADHHQHLDLIRPMHQRTVSDSSVDSAFKAGSSAAMPMPPMRFRRLHRHRSPKAIKMRPGTPELPDSTDFVCGTLDEDRPMEEAYLSCLKQRKLERQGIIPQDLDPSFPTSDPENNDEEDEVTEGNASTASDHHFLGGRFDESDGSPRRGRVSGSHDRASSKQLSPPRPNSPAPRSHLKSPVATPASKIRARSPAPAAMQRVKTKSPAPPPMQRIRTKSPAPATMQRPRPRSPAPRKLFESSPIQSSSSTANESPNSPPASPRNIRIQTACLAQRPGHVMTASLPHTPNPFFFNQEARLRSGKRKSARLENHDRGPVDIKQGLEARKQRRKEHYWRKHCRDHKDKNRRCAPGKGAERMRELGIEMAHRNKAYGQKLELMLSV